MCGKRFEHRTGKTTEVVVYSNQTEVSLYNNGKLLETKTGEHAFHFKVALEEENHLEVVSKDLRDEATIYKVKEADPSYKVKKGKSQNWV